MYESSFGQSQIRTEYECIRLQRLPLRAAELDLYEISFNR